MNHKNCLFGGLTGRLLLVVIVAVASGVALPSPASARPATLGLQLPFPTAEVPLTTSDSLGIPSGIQLVRLWLTVDTAGAVSNVAPTQAMGTDHLRLLQRYFSRVKFVPGKRNDTVRTARVLVELVRSADSTLARVRYPIAPDSQISVSELYRSSCAENGMQAAAWKRFPWFHAVVSPSDSATIPRFALIRVNLSARGGMVGRELVSTNCGGFSDQLVNATAWATYQPAKMGGKPLASTNFLLVTFYPTISYPTKPLVAAKPDTSTWHRKYLLQMLPDTLGVMTEPVPRAPTSTNLLATVPPGQARRTFVIPCGVDSAGFLHLKAPYADSSGIPRLCAEIAKLVRLYPALDYRGGPKPFEGYVEITTLNQTNVRIRYLWLR